MQSKCTHFKILADNKTKAFPTAAVLSNVLIYKPPCVIKKYK